MKVVWIVLAISFLCIGSVFAAPCKGCPLGPQGPQGEQGVQGEQGIQGEKGETGEGYNDHFVYGPGLDVTLWQNDCKTVGVESQYKYDMENDGHSAYLVLKVNLWDILKKGK